MLDAFEPKMLEMQAALYSQIVVDQLIGRVDDELAEYWDAVGEALKASPNSLDNGRLGTGILKVKVPTELPQKICTYRKPKVYWFGELHGSNNFVWNEGYATTHHHWTVGVAMEPRPKQKLSELLYGNTLKMKQMEAIRSRGQDITILDTEGAYHGKRFIGISEPRAEDQVMDSDFLKGYTGDPYEVTGTTTGRWKPQGDLQIMSGSPLPKINYRSKETIERVKRIEYPEAP